MASTADGGRRRARKF
uniref:Uncharacterized protein n=1 Tax=Arundo donax TaxID=35708 RepID=A0A0A9AJ20_ARUDO